MEAAAAAAQHSTGHHQQRETTMPITRIDLLDSHHRRHSTSLPSYSSARLQTPTAPAADPCPDAVAAPCSSRSLSTMSQSSSTASSPRASLNPVHCLVFMRTAFGEKGPEQLERAQAYLVQQLRASELISTRIYFHAHFASPDRLKAALEQSREAVGPFQPRGAVCLSRNCGVERHSVEGRVKRAGLDYSEVRRWILANKRVVLWVDEVFRDMRDDHKAAAEQPDTAERATAEAEVRQRIDETQRELGYAALPPSEKHLPEHHLPSAPSTPPQSPPTSRPASISSAPLAPILAPTRPAAVSAAPLPSKPSSALRVYVKSRAGSSWDPCKVNQDRPLACVPLRGHPGVHLYGVMDGHGQWGHHVSQYVMELLPAFLSAEKALRGRSVSEVKDAMLRAVRSVCDGLADANINLAFSGTTLVFALHCDERLYTANIGDSRGVLIRAPDLPGFPPFTLPLTTDHKPDVPSEQARIIQAGGRVCPIPGMDSGPSRVWLADLDEPGLAMSRSIGDEVSASVGVIAVPDVTVHELEERDVAVLFASDGVWEFVSNEEAVALVWKHIEQPAVAVNQLVAESVRRWKEDSDQVIDDITVVLVKFR